MIESLILLLAIPLNHVRLHDRCCGASVSSHVKGKISMLNSCSILLPGEHHRSVFHAASDSAHGWGCSGSSAW